MLLDLNDEEIDKLYSKLIALKIHKRILKMGYELDKCPLLDLYAGIDDGWYNSIENIANCIGGILGDGEVGSYDDSALSKEIIDIFEKFKVNTDEVIAKTEYIGTYIFINNNETKKAIKNNIKVDDVELNQFKEKISNLTMNDDYIFSISEDGYLLVFYDDYLDIEELIDCILDLMDISRRFKINE